MVEDSKRLAVDEVYPESSGYIGKQYRKENESTRTLCDWVRECSGDSPPRSILDAGCGDGAILLSMRNCFPEARLTGFDAAEAMVSYATKNLPADIHIQKGDMLDIAGITNEKFDVVYSVHTLSLFPAFEPVLLELMRAANQSVYINSLFSRHNIDMYVNTHEEGFPPAPWNIFSMKRFSSFAMDNGAKNIEFKPFEMPVELPDKGDGMGSYTRQLADGRYLTFTGPLFLPWCFVRIDV